MIKHFKSFVVVLLLAGFALCAFANVNGEPLPGDTAFQLTATMRDSEAINLNWTIAPGYFLYRSRVHVRAQNSDDQLGTVVLPNGRPRKDATGNILQVYEQELSVDVPLITHTNNTVRLLVDYQGCSEMGACYPPMRRHMTLNVDGEDVQPILAQAPEPVSVSHTPGKLLSSYHHLLTARHWPVIIGSFVLFGLMIALTPCMLPLLPILLSIITGQRRLTVRVAFGLSLAYTLGMAVAYAVLGIVFAYLGANVQAWLQQPWVITVFGAVFVIMALSLFGLFHLELPQVVRAAAAEASNKQQGGSYTGVFMMGLLSIFILSPCVTPPLVGILSYIGHQGDVFIGGVALFCLGIGLGLPLIVLSLFGGKLLPKAGPWMNAIKHILGVLMLIIAVTLFERVLPAMWIEYIWAALAIGCALFLGVFHTAETRFKALCKLPAILLFVYGIIIAVGASQGNTNPLRPIYFAQRSAYEQLAWHSPKTPKQLTALLRQPAPGKPIALLNVTADWCLSCQDITHYVLSDKRVAERLKHFKLIRLDVTKNTDSDKLLEKMMDVIAPPTLLFFEGTAEIPHSRLVGSIAANDFLEHLDKLTQTKVS